MSRQLQRLVMFVFFFSAIPFVRAETVCLVVDDTPSVNKMVVKSIQLRNIPSDNPAGKICDDIISVNSGNAALETIQNDPRISSGKKLFIIMDYNMPVMNGDKTVEEIDKLVKNNELVKNKNLRIGIVANSDNKIENADDDPRSNNDKICDKSRTFPCLKNEKSPASLTKLPLILSDLGKQIDIQENSAKRIQRAGLLYIAKQKSTISAQRPALATRTKPIRKISMFRTITELIEGWNRSDSPRSPRVHCDSPDSEIAAKIARTGAIGLEEPHSTPKDNGSAK